MQEIELNDHKASHVMLNEVLLVRRCPQGPYGVEDAIDLMDM